MAEGPLDVGHYAMVTVADSDGITRRIDVPDYEVVGWTLEFTMLAHRCETLLATRQAKVEQRPLDTEVNHEASYLTFGEREKVIQLARPGAQRALVQGQPVAC